MGKGIPASSYARPEDRLNTINPTDSRPFEIGKFVISESELCKALGISRMTAYRYRESGKLGYVKIGTKIKYLPDHINAFILRYERKAEE